MQIEFLSLRYRRSQRAGGLLNKHSHSLPFACALIHTWAIILSHVLETWGKNAIMWSCRRSLFCGNSHESTQYLMLLHMKPQSPWTKVERSNYRGQIALTSPWKGLEAKKNSHKRERSVTFLKRIIVYQSTMPSPTAWKRSSVSGFIGTTCLQSGSFSRALLIQLTKAYFSSSVDTTSNPSVYHATNLPSFYLQMCMGRKTLLNLSVTKKQTPMGRGLWGDRQKYEFVKLKERWGRMYGVTDHSCCKGAELSLATKGIGGSIYSVQMTNSAEWTRQLCNCPSLT